MGSYKRGILTAIQLKFVAAYEGDGSAAAREAGAKNPSQYANWALKNPAVLKGIEEKQQKVITDSATLLAKRLAKADILATILYGIGIVKAAAEKVAKKKHVRNDDVATLTKVLDSFTKAGMTLAELQGWVIHKNFNLDKMLDGRSAEEMDYFGIHGYWPEVEPGQPGAAGPKSPGQEPSHPN